MRKVPTSVMVDSLVGKCGARILPLGAEECEATPNPSPRDESFDIIASVP